MPEHSCARSAALVPPIIRLVSELIDLVVWLLPTIITTSTSLCSALTAPCSEPLKVASSMPTAMTWLLLVMATSLCPVKTSVSTSIATTSHRLQELQSALTTNSSSLYPHIFSAVFFPHSSFFSRFSLQTFCHNSDDRLDLCSQGSLHLCINSHLFLLNYRHLHALFYGFIGHICAVPKLFDSSVSFMQYTFFVITFYLLTTCIVPANFAFNNCCCF